ncbi:hypothetical protein LCGC14_0882760 [marine sediment metagenome]|uniref:Uncharacterized protein n=1 Tax=marine sediment metagenome TaxID=412755 RepID=A0A0F9S8E4_9ZZZZ
MSVKREQLTNVKISTTELLIQFALGTFESYNLLSLVQTSKDSAVLTAAAKYFAKINVEANGTLIGARADIILNAFIGNENTPPLVKEYVMLARQIKSLKNCKRDIISNVTNTYYDKAKDPLQRNFDYIHSLLFED